MELQKSEVVSLNKMIEEWTLHPTYELEASFGGPKGLEMTEFLAVIKRLKARFGGDAELHQEDRLTITLKNHSRFTLVDKGEIQKYCGDNSLEFKSAIAIIKDKTGPESDFKLDEYNVHIKNRREVEMTNEQKKVEMQRWAEKDKAFRLISRWTFEDDDLKYEASVVYSTPKRRVGDSDRYDYAWQKRYTDRNIRAQTPQYEVEVELKHTEKNKDKDYAMKALIRGMGEVLRGIQKSPVLIRESVKLKVLGNYAELAGVQNERSKFRGNPPVTLLYKNILPPEMVDEDSRSKQDKITLYGGYNVTDKADGLRVLAYCDPEGVLYLIDMSMQVYRTALQKESCKNCLLDGEWVTMNKKNESIQQLLLFDVFVINEKDVSQLPFYTESVDDDSRHKRMVSWVQKWKEDKGPTDLLNRKSTTLSVSVKEFLFAKAGDKSIFQKANEMLTKTDQPIYPYHTDGLIFTPNSLPLPKGAGQTFYEQFKWKPANDNTIDFLVEAVKDPQSDKESIFTGLRSDGSTVQYKKYVLYVKGVLDSVLKNPRESVLNGVFLPAAETSAKPLPVTKIPFEPNEFSDPLAYVCNIEVVENHDFTITENNEPIQSGTIVEMRYDISEFDHEWRWKPLRIRHDKTARYQASVKESKGRKIGSRTLNGFESAMDVWLSIHQPITRSMITSGSTTPSDEEVQAEVKSVDSSIQRYYQNATTYVNKRIVQSMADFHNYYIKESILLGPTIKKSPETKTLIDLAVGQGSDIGRWRRAGAKFVFGVDKAAFGILDKENGAYRRYINQYTNIYKANKRAEQEYRRKEKEGIRVNPPEPQTIAPMIFAIGDSSKDIPSGDSAGTEKLDANIMRSLYGTGAQGQMPPLVQKFSNVLKNGADVVTMMFALHYMFETPETFDGFLKNLNRSVKVGGYFVGCCFDGEKVFNLLQSSGIKKDNTLQRSITRADGVNVKIWSITRRYDNNEFLEDEKEAFGQAIDVEFVSIGAQYTEYLVPFRLLKKKLESIGMVLLSDTEAKTMGLKHGTNTFDESWDMAKDKDGNTRYGMPEEVKEFSFLNRWFIFKRVDTQERVTEAAPTGAKIGAKVTLAGGSRETIDLDDLPDSEKEPILMKKEFELNDVFQFHVEAPLTDRYKLGDKSAARWLAPISRFPISDDDGIEYPSLDHYMAAMRYKYGAKMKDGSDVPSDFIQAMFGHEGSIHQRALRAEIRERGEKNIDEDQLKVILKQEYDEIQKQVKPSGLKANNLVPDDATWSEHREDILREGLRQRWERDDRFRKIVQALMRQNKYLLYYNPSVGMSYYGGMRKANKTIEGENMVGKLIMQLAGYSESK